VVVSDQKVRVALSSSLRTSRARRVVRDAIMRSSSAILSRKSASDAGHSSLCSWPTPRHSTNGPALLGVMPVRPLPDLAHHAYVALVVVAMAVGPSVRCQQTEPFVVVDSLRRHACTLRQLTDLHVSPPAAT
jgi:hypothetical protein